VLFSADEWFHGPTGPGPLDRDPVLNPAPHPRLKRSNCARCWRWKRARPSGCQQITPTRKCGQRRRSRVSVFAAPRWSALFPERSDEQDHADSYSGGRQYTEEFVRHSRQLVRQAHPERIPPKDVRGGLARQGPPRWAARRYHGWKGDRGSWSNVDELMRERVVPAGARAGGTQAADWAGRPAA